MYFWFFIHFMNRDYTIYTGHKIGFDILVPPLLLSLKSVEFSNSPFLIKLTGYSRHLSSSFKIDMFISCLFIDVPFWQ